MPGDRREKQVGVYRSKVRRADGKAVYQNPKNSGTNRGLYKRGRNRKNYIPKKYKKNVFKRAR